MPVPPIIDATARTRQIISFTFMPLHERCHVEAASMEIEKRRSHFRAEHVS
jgi:hypothetical protein